MPTFDFYGQSVTIDYVYSYDRVSSAQQTPEHGGQGIDRQAALRAAFSARFGIPIDEEYVDLGKSGSKGANLGDGGARRAFKQLALKKKLRGNPGLVIESFSRLCRLHIDEALGLFFDIVCKGGVTLITLVDNRAYTQKLVRTRGAIHGISAHMEAARAEAEAKAYFSKMGWVKRRDKVTAMCPGWLTPNAGRTGYDKLAAAQTVMDRVYSEGEYLGLSQIAARLNREGVAKFPIWNNQKTPPLWRNTHIRHIITSRTTRGEREIGQYDIKVRRKTVDGEEVEYQATFRTATGDRQLNVYPVMVSEEQWQRTNAALEARTSGRGPKGKAFTNLLQGLCKCSLCGGTMVVASKSKKRSGKVYQYFRCVNLRIAACDNRFSYQYQTLEAEFLKVFAGIIVAFMKKAPSHVDATTVLQNQIAEGYAEIDGWRGREKYLRDALLKDSNRSSADAEKLSAILDLPGLRAAKLAEIARLEKKLAQVRAIPMPKEQVKALARLIDQMPQVPEADRYSLRAKINSQLKAFIARIEFSADGEVTVRFGYDGYQYSPHPQFRADYKIRFFRDADRTVERDHPYSAVIRLAHARRPVDQGS
jgi:Recombinase zinc beta ribbon domain/Recombinase/Resolvase, N terminal domain